MSCLFTLLKSNHYQKVHSRVAIRHMVRAKKAPATPFTDSPEPCIVCQRAVTPSQVLCTCCTKRLKVICSNKTDKVDRALTEALQLGRHRERKKRVQNLAHHLDSSRDVLIGDLERRKKHVKALTEQVRKLKRRLGSNNFKKPDVISSSRICH